MFVSIASPTLFGETNRDQEKTLSIVVDKKGTVTEFKVHNLSYSEVAKIISAISGLKIEVTYLPEKQFTFLAKDCPWKVVVWGAFNNQEISLQKINAKEYRVVKAK